VSLTATVEVTVVFELGGYGEREDWHDLEKRAVIRARRMVKNRLGDEVTIDAAKLTCLVPEADE